MKQPANRAVATGVVGVAGYDGCMRKYEPLTLRGLAALLANADDDKTRWKLVWEFLEEYR